jgi:ATP-binding cassette subfamily B multidrug efflux pump
VVNLYQRGAASMGRLNRILEQTPAITVSDDPTSLADARGAIEFRGVSFAYPGTERLVLDDVSFTVEAGASIAIVGPTGSGKTTIVALLSRLYDPTSGTILLDGIPITQVDPEELRLRIGMVPQDPFLFSDTIEGNIGLGIPYEDEDASGKGTDTAAGTDIAVAVQRSAEIAQLHDQIIEFPKGYETLLGERGINLSGGQKQRATLARALTRDPLILVLDDALSAVDTHTESAILSDLQGVTQTRTSFVISHRVSAVMDADKILVLEEGRIVQQGRHTDLIRAEGTYARLLRRQLLEEDLAAESA